MDVTKVELFELSLFHGGANKIPSAKVLATEINIVSEEILFSSFGGGNMKNYFRNKSDFSCRWHELKVAGSCKAREQSEGVCFHSNA